MSQKAHFSWLLTILLVPATFFGQGGVTKTRSARLTLEVTKQVKSEMAGIFALPLKCDAAGKLYLRSPDDTTIVKITPDKGERQATFPSRPLPTDLKRLRYFDVEPDGSLLQLASVRQSFDRAVVEFDALGGYKRTIRLQTGFKWAPSQIASFTSAHRILVSGQRTLADTKAGERTRLPFTGIFDDDGKLIREVKFADDADLHQMAESGDPVYVSSEVPDSNRAITHGAAESGPDGNVYLMRAAAPPIIYAVTSDGDVIRRFRVDPGETAFAPLQPLHISGNRIAVLFHDNNNQKQLVKVVSLSGEELATYDTAEGRDSPGPTLACYSAADERFTFLQESAENRYLILRVFQPR